MKNTTAKINVQISYAEAALDLLEGDPSEAEKREAMDAIRLVLKVAEHKILRIQELEMELAKHKNKKSVLELDHDYEDEVVFKGTGSY